MNLALLREPNRRRNAHSVAGALPRSDPTRFSPLGSYQVWSLPVGTENHQRTQSGSATPGSARYDLELSLRSSEHEEESSFVPGAERGALRARAIAGVWYRSLQESCAPFVASYVSVYGSVTMCSNHLQFGELVVKTSDPSVERFCN